MTKKSMTYGILPSFDEFQNEYTKECPTGNYRITKDKIVGNRTFISARELYDYLIWLIQKWNNNCSINVDVDIVEEYGNLAASILYSLNFEWI